LPAAKKSRQKKAAQTAHAKWAPLPGSASGSVESGPPQPPPGVTKGSSAPTPHSVRRGWVCQGNQGLRQVRWKPSASFEHGGGIGFVRARREPSASLGRGGSIRFDQAGWGHRLRSGAVGAIVFASAGCGMCEHCGVLEVPPRRVKHGRKNVAGGFMTYASARAAPPEE